MSSDGSWVMATGLLVAMVAVSAGVDSRGVANTVGGYGPLVSLLGLLAGVNLISLGVWMTNGPLADSSPTASPSKAPLTACVRRNPAVVGIVLSSSAVAAGQAICLGLLTLLLIGISLTTLGVLGASAP